MLSICEYRASEARGFVLSVFSARAGGQVVPLDLLRVVARIAADDAAERHNAETWAYLDRLAEDGEDLDSPARLSFFPSVPPWSFADYLVTEPAPISPATDAARAVVHAVKHLRKRCGAFSARRYAELRGASHGMYQAAEEFEDRRDLRRRLDEAWLDYGRLPAACAEPRK